MRAYGAAGRAGGLDTADDARWLDVVEDPAFWAWLAAHARQIATERGRGAGGDVCLWVAHAATLVTELAQQEQMTGRTDDAIQAT